jgi:hypothetical protein
MLCKRRHADTPTRRHADTPIRRYADTFLFRPIAKKVGEFVSAHTPSFVVYLKSRQKDHQKGNMSTQTTKSEYLLLFRGAQWDKGLSPEGIQKIMGQWNNWFERLTLEGKVKGAQPLEREGKIVSGKGRTVADGPFAESKEAIGGYFLLVLDDFNEALEIAKECPALEYGLTVEVRPVADQCRTMQRLNEVLVATA